MPNEIDVQDASKLAADIVVAYLGSGDRSVEPERLPDLVRQVRHALTGDLARNKASAVAESNVRPSAEAERSEGRATAKEPGELRPAVPVEESIHPDYLVSLEDGRHYRSLRRHLMAKHGLTPDQYRARWGLPADYPMVAPNYAQARSEVAKRSGLGRSRRPVEQKPATSRAAAAKGGNIRH